MTIHNVMCPVIQEAMNFNANELNDFTVIGYLATLYMYMHSY